MADANIDLLIQEAIQKTRNKVKSLSGPLSASETKKPQQRTGPIALDPSKLTPTMLASMIDHTLLKADASIPDLQKLCEEARRYDFKTVCVNSANIPFVSKCLTGSNVLPIAVVGFPLGAMLSSAKAFETQEAIRNGAREIDMVINIGRLKSGELDFVFDDIKAVVSASRDIPVKVIIETSLLTDEEKIIASFLTKEAGATFVKTSTGFASGGAKEEDLKLIRKVVGKATFIKASGGIKTYFDAMTMIGAGADRLGSSASVSILEEAKKRSL